MLPIARHPITLLARKDYNPTSTHITSLCAVRTYAGKQLRLYRWHRRHDQEEWKVAFANFALHDINLEQVARDAYSLAREHGIQLQWTGPQTEALIVEDELPVFDGAIHEDDSEPGVEARPLCPCCRTNEDTVPIIYGFAEFNGERDSDADYEVGGWGYSVEAPLWHCKQCLAEWGRVTWSDSEPVRRTSKRCPRR